MVIGANLNLDWVLTGYGPSGRGLFSIFGQNIFWGLLAPLWFHHTSLFGAHEGQNGPNHTQHRLKSLLKAP